MTILGLYVAFRHQKKKMVQRFNPLYEEYCVKSSAYVLFIFLKSAFREIHQCQTGQILFKLDVL